jgi:dihydrofolate reductase
MRKIKLYMAISLDGKIAKADGSVEWLEAIPNPDNSDYGYSDFYQSIDTTIQGNTTYQQIIGWGIDFPYPDKKNYVVTRKQGMPNTEHVEFISSNPAAFIRRLKEEEGKDIWLVGGAQLNSMLLEANLIDEIQLFVMPVILTEGIDMFSSLPVETPLKLVNTKAYSNGVVALTYALHS